MPLLADQGWIRFPKTFRLCGCLCFDPPTCQSGREQARQVVEKRHQHRDALPGPCRGQSAAWTSKSEECLLRGGVLLSGIRAATPGFEGCCACGQPTHSWCEGCYARIQQSPSNTFSAICQRCDGESWVCDLCSRVGITHAQGKEAYERSRPGVAVTEETVEVTGWSTSEGFETQTPVHVPLRTIAANTGLSKDEVRAQLSFRPDQV